MNDVSELLAGRRVLVTGVLTERSIAFAIAQGVQRAGGQVLLTGHGRLMRMTRRAARSLPQPAEVVEFDASEPASYAALADRIERTWGGVDGVVHSIAWMTNKADKQIFLKLPTDEIMRTLEVTALSYARLASVLDPLLGRGASLVGLTLDATVAWPSYGWLGVAKATLESINRYLACELGPRGIRSNLIASGPIRSVASETFGVFPLLCASWQAQAPLGWNADDATPVGDAALFLLSELAGAITGTVLHADGGYSAAAAPYHLDNPAVGDAGRLMASWSRRRD